MFNTITKSGKTGKIRRISIAALMLITAGSAGSLFAEGGRLSLAASGGASIFDGETVAQMGLTLSAPVSPWLDLTLSGNAFHTLARGYTGAEGTYQAEVGWTALGLRPHLRLNDRVDIGFPVTSGSGILRFRYESEYRDDLTWTEEVPDQVIFWTQTAGTDLRVKVSEQMSMSLEGGWRLTSPLRSPLADDDDLSSWYAVAGAVYRL
jgi:hypothetical protein